MSRTARRRAAADPAAARPGFRPDIQGLRALAVVLVVLDHARIGPFTGGFVGVDVFFVISGFLITSLLLGEAERDGRVSLLGFWARRAKRILPAATVVLAATVAAGYLLLNAVEALRLFTDAVWATFFAANLRFASTETDYFAQDQATSPLQHFWSLAVEEQFYLVWPLLVAALVAWWGARGRTRRAVGLAVAAVCACSFLWALVSVRTDLAGAYFSTPARAWELGLGALTATALLRVRRLPPALLGAASWVGLGMVAWAALGFTAQTPVPGAPALLPVVGTALLLGGGTAAPGWGPQRLLSVAPARWVGDRSYSLYLWHWPALVLVGAVWRTPSGWSGAAVALGALVLADLTYRLVENPFRTATWLRPRWRGVALYPVSVAALALVVGAAQWSVVRDYRQERPPVTVAAYGQDTPGGESATLSGDPDVALVEASVLAARNDVAVPNPLQPAALGLADRVAAELGDCEYFDQPFPLPLCPMADTDSDKVMVGLGDSHLRHWIPALTQVAERAGYRAYWFVYQGCTPAAVTPWLARSAEPDQACADFHAWSQQEIEELQPDVVVASTDVERSYVDDRGDLVDGADVAPLIQQTMTQRLESIEPHAGRVVVLGDPPHLEMDPDVISERGATLADGLSEPEPRSMRMRRAVKAATKAAGAEYVETRPWFCAYDECPVVVGDYITRRDPAHLTLEYAAHLAGPLGRALHLR